MTDLAPSNRHPGPAWLRPVFTGLLAAAIAGYAIYLARYSSPYAGGADSSGYINSARLLSQGRLFTLPRVLPGHLAGEFGDLSVVPLGFALRPGGRMAPTYPTGYPLQLVAAAVFGWARAATVVNVMTALAGGFLLFAYCRRLGLNTGLALGGMALLWLCPLLLFAALQPMSDLSALCWSLAALYCALGARDGWIWGLLCGLATGIAILVRPTDLLLVVPVMVALGFRPRAWLAVGLGSLPATAFFCFYNWRVYGSPLVTGYGDVWGAFRAEYLPHNLAYLALWIPTLLSPVITLALAAPFLPAVRRRGYVVLAVWFATLTGFYAFYYHTGETWWYLRFILPAFPVLIVAALVVLDTAWRAAKSRPVPAAAALVVLLILAAGWQQRQILRLDVLHLEKSERTYPAAARWAQQNLPPKSAIFCMQVSGAFFYYTDFLLLRWDQIAPEKFAPLLDAVARQDRPVYAALFPFETADAQERIGGHWTKLATEGQVTFWQRQP